MMKKYKYGVIGSFVFGKETYGGQSIKTKNFTAALKNAVGEDNVLCIDTRGWKKKPLQLVMNIRKALKECEDVVILPADRGVLVIPRLVKSLKGFGKNRLLYVVIGGWLPEFLEKRKGLTKVLQSYNGIFVETATMKTNLEKIGFDNIVVLPNFKQLNLIDENALVYPDGVPYKLCTFSRVMKEKGIETAVEVIKKANEKLGYTAFSLDIYGQVWEDSTEWFDKLKQRFPAYVRYCGCVDASKSVEVLCNYYALLFPTHYYTEGIPGTIIDAYAAGIPVISAKWESFADVVDEGKTGLGYEFDNAEAFEDILLQVAKAPQLLLNMKPRCLDKVKEYVPETAKKIMLEKFGGGGV